MLGSSSGHAGIVEFAAQLVDVVVLDVNGDGADAAVIAGELKRIKEKVWLIPLVGEGQALFEARSIVPTPLFPGWMNRNC